MCHVREGERKAYIFVIWNCVSEFCSGNFCTNVCVSYEDEKPKKLVEKIFTSEKNWQ